MAHVEFNFLNAEFAEADTFFCFTHLMSEIRDFFIKTLDETIGGIKAMMSKVNEELKVEDFDVWQLLKSQQLFPQYYSFRYQNYKIFFYFYSRKYFFHLLYSDG